MLDAGHIGGSTLGVGDDEDTLEGTSGLRWDVVLDLVVCVVKAAAVVVGRTEVVEA